MPSRLIRDEMLDSERLQTLPIEARWLFLAIMLTADDVGLFEVALFKISRRAGIDQQKIPVLLQLLSDSDLVRLYEAEGKRFGFIPRFRQRLQIKRTRYPAPPAALVLDDEDAARKFKELAANPPLDNRNPPLDNRLNLNLNLNLNKKDPPTPRQRGARMSHPEKPTPAIPLTVPSDADKQTAAYLAKQAEHASITETPEQRAAIAERLRAARLVVTAAKEAA
jgi:hypothetical protein